MLNRTVRNYRDGLKTVLAGNPPDPKAVLALGFGRHPVGSVFAFYCTPDMRVSFGTPVPCEFAGYGVYDVAGDRTRFLSDVQLFGHKVDRPIRPSLLVDVATSVAWRSAKELQFRATLKTHSTSVDLEGSLDQLLPVCRDTRFVDVKNVHIACPVSVVAVRFSVGGLFTLSALTIFSASGLDEVYNANRDATIAGCYIVAGDRIVPRGTLVGPLSSSCLMVLLPASTNQLVKANMLMPSGNQSNQVTMPADHWLALFTAVYCLENKLRTPYIAAADNVGAAVPFSVVEGARGDALVFPVVAPGAFVAVGVVSSGHRPTRASLLMDQWDVTPGSKQVDLHGLHVYIVVSPQGPTKRTLPDKNGPDQTTSLILMNEDKPVVFLSRLRNATVSYKGSSFPLCYDRLLDNGMRERVVSTKFPKDAVAVSLCPPATVFLHKPDNTVLAVTVKGGPRDLYKFAKKRGVGGDNVFLLYPDEDGSYLMPVPVALVEEAG